jgi:hypothetical protein
MILKKRVLVIMAVMMVLGFTAVATAATGSPGSEADPVVTKSYVDEKIAEIKNGTGSASESFVPLQILSGKTFIGGEGTEVILRSGEATAIDNGANGVSDLTSGGDLVTGNAVSLNHLLLIPRNDGRGLKATTDIWVLVKGKYDVQ